jgi:hypothetical protein
MQSSQVLAAQASTLPTTPKTGRTHPTNHQMPCTPTAPVSLSESAEAIRADSSASGEGQAWPFWAGGGLLGSLQLLASHAGQPATSSIATNSTTAGAAISPGLETPLTLSKSTPALPAVEPSPEPAHRISLQYQTGACASNEGSSALSQRHQSLRGSAHTRPTVADTSVAGALESRPQAATVSSDTQFESLLSSSEHQDGRQRSSKGGLASLLQLPDFSFQVPGFQVSGSPTGATPPEGLISARTATTPGRASGYNQPTKSTGTSSW